MSAHATADPVSDDEDFYSDEEESLLNRDFTHVEEHDDRKSWDKFRTVPPKDVSGSLANKETVMMWAKIFKVVAYVLCFIIVLSAAAISKGTLLYMTSQITPDITHDYCPEDYGSGKAMEALVSKEERVAWIWAIFFSFITPEFFMLFRSLRICMFRKWKTPQLSHFLLIAIFELLHVIGLSVLVYVVLPFLEVVQGAMITNCVSFVPAILCMLSRQDKESKRVLKTVFDIFAALAQLSGCFVWAVTTWFDKAGDPRQNLVWILPIALILTSFGWWENYVDKDSPFGIVKYLGGIKEQLKETRYFTYIFISIFKMAAFLCCLLAIEFCWSYLNGSTLTPGDISHLFNDFKNGFGEHNVTIKEVPPINSMASIVDEQFIKSWADTAGIVYGIQAGASLLCFLTGKFASKILIQGFGYALPINLTIPLTITILISFCSLKAGSPCMFSDPVMPGYLFWNCPDGNYLIDILTDRYAWLWLLWLLSQAWIAIHIWNPKCERLASTEKLFVHSFYNSLLIDQSMSMNRRRDDESEVLTTDLDMETGPDIDMNEMYEQQSTSSDNGSAKPKASDSITRIYTCATMWHESPDEIVTFLKSIFYLDEDQSARRVAQKYLAIVDPDYYEIETHIFFDDAFEMSDDNEDEVVVNKFVTDLVNSMDEAGSYVHQTNIRIRAPKKYPTPYGGRLVWTLPGKTKVICHLKDKAKIRHKKRWSQCMYMYYLLGFKLMELPISIERKTTIADNTYLLALDGDIDFTPDAVQLLVDLMKKNRNLGAACGRIHPVGSGLMAWYQMFEYAIGHWLQKATEHMLGCVLCSPGCFSLFRGRALMEDNIMAKYTTVSTEARHYVQYDQGEDRWLCTLMLQRGFRVEYSAASDAYTHCPEGFGEFFNQRRRWVPSTMANILDLLMDYKRTVAVNDNISMPYIFYQVLIMVGTIVGPGTIFLMIVGSVVAAFKISQWTSFIINLAPIIVFMIICLTTKSNTQVFVAQMLSIAYAIIMMAVMVGIVLELNVEGLASPSGIFLIMMAASFIISAILHPQEFWCLPYGLVYYLTVPSMYLLLIIYSLSNLNNVSWGTRETVQKKKKPTPQELEEQKKAAEAAKKQAKREGLFGSFFNPNNKDDDEGSIEFSLAGLFKIMCCVTKKPQEEMKQLMVIAESLNALNRRLDSIEKIIDPSGSNLRRRSISSKASVRTTRSGSGQAGPAGDILSVVNEDAEEEFDLDMTDEESVAPEPVMERDDEVNPYWIDDKKLKRGEVDFLGSAEITFFKELIERYLRPLDENKEEKKKAEAALKELRDNVVFAFYIINALYVTVVFLLTLEKENVYIRWPFGLQYTFNYKFSPNFNTGDVEFTTEYLKLEPIGFVFVIFFGSILLVQFVAMLFHRFGTMSHILASTNITLFKKKLEDISEDAYIEKHGVKMAREMQKLAGLGDGGDADSSLQKDHTGRRRTLAYLEKSTAQKQTTGNLDMAFRKRLMSISPEGQLDPNSPMSNNLRKMSMRRDTLQALGRRRSTVVAEMRRRSSVHMLAQPRGSIAMNNRRASTLSTTAEDRYE